MKWFLFSTLNPNSYQWVEVGCVCARSVQVSGNSGQVGDGVRQEIIEEGCVIIIPAQ